MEIINVMQGTPEWHAHRAGFNNASDVASMMDESKFKSRSEFVIDRATGIKKEVDAATQSRFEEGHRTEALARPLAERIIGEDLFPVVGVNGRLSASFDGLTMDEMTGFEHKLLNDEIRAVLSGAEDDNEYIVHDSQTGRELPLIYRLQMQQQCMVSGATHILFGATRWEGETCVEQRWCWYESDFELAADIERGWAQFERDVAEFKPVEVKAEAVGKTIAALPSLSIQLVGEVKNSNLALYKSTALDFVRSINTDLQTDQHFADAENVIKFCDKAEKELEVVKKAALGQTASIDELFRTVDDLKDAMRAKRLELEKLVKARKESIRVEIVAAANVALGEFAKEQSSRLAGRISPPATRANFAEAIKGKKTISGLREGIDAEMARAKIELVSATDKLLLSLAAFDAAVGGYDFLFRDLQMLVQKDAEAVTAIVAQRISEHKQAEEAKRKAEQERIERETRERIEREEREKIAAEERAKAQAEVKAESPKAVEAKAPTMTEQEYDGRPPKAKPVEFSKRIQPSDDQIISAIATHFNVDAPTVVCWLFNIDFAALESQKESA